jgi:hypothetical protein
LNLANASDSCLIRDVTCTKLSGLLLLIVLAHNQLNPRGFKQRQDHIQSQMLSDLHDNGQSFMKI